MSRPSRPKTLLLSLIVETGTQKTTGRIPFQQMMRRYLEEVRQTLPKGRYEILFVGNGRPAVKLPPDCRFLDRPGLGYYGFKNEGAKAARGKYLVFWDSDCRVKKGYLKRLLELYRRNPRIIGVGGRSYYDKPHIFSRVNTIICFGPFCQDMPRLTRQSAISHNVSIRKDAFPAEPFGPFTGRSGGDMFLTQTAVQKGEPLLFDPELEIHHEDVTTHLEALLERLLRDLFTPVVFVRSRSLWAALATGYWHWPILNLKRLRRVLIYGRHYGVEWYDLPGSLLALAYFAFLEMAALLCMTAWPPLFTRWIHFQFGSRWIGMKGLSWTPGSTSRPLQENAGHSGPVPAPGEA